MYLHDSEDLELSLRNPWFLSGRSTLYVAIKCIFENVFAGFFLKKSAGNIKKSAKGLVSHQHPLC